MSGINAMIWKTQDVLHKKPQIVPGVLLSLAGSLIVVRHMTHETHTDDSIKTFLFLILLQMLPLVALEMKIMSCADPVGLFCKFATPVTMIHAVFLGMRLIQHYVQSESIWDDTAQMLTASVGFAGAILTMTKGFRQNCLRIAMESKSAWGLIFIGFMAALATNTVDLYLVQPTWRRHVVDWSTFFADVFTNANSYIEITAFVPAVLMVFRENSYESRVQVESAETRRVSLAFFLFLVGFYITEDVVNAYQAYEMTMLASMAHLAHFLLLVDFAFYVLAHIYNPEKLVGELRRWLPVDFSCEV